MDVRPTPVAATVGPGELHPDRPLGVGGTVWEKAEPPLDRLPAASGLDVRAGRR